jgi:hypothetical protein
MTPFEKITRLFAARGGRPFDLANPDVSESLRLLLRLADGGPGYWSFRETGVTDRHHPVKKAKLAFERFKEAVAECERTAGLHTAKELNAARILMTYFFQTEALEDINEAFDMALGAGSRPAHRPPEHEPFKYFVIELRFLCEGTGLPVRGEEFAGLVWECQNILPSPLRLKDYPALAALVEKTATSRPIRLPRN